jgi:hypothetical protein
MALTIPVFRALIAADTERKFHRNHGQLGFALKDQKRPELGPAEETLTEAISRRGPVERGWLLYEFNRAICRINLDASGPGPSTADVQKTILDDMQAAARSKDLHAKLVKVPEVESWLKRNNISPATLSASTAST